MKRVLALLACAFASVAYATPPDAPTITVAATDIKQLQFDITPVARVSWYELWFRANPGAQWVKYAEQKPQRPLFRINASVHLLDWQQARYFVKACNSGGCGQSNEVGIDGEQLAAIGYFKPATYGALQYFGFSFALSADGTTLASVAADKINHVNGSAAIHVFRKGTSTSGWRLETRLFPDPNSAGASSVIGDQIAITTDGNTIAYSNWVENSTTGGVYVFRRASDGWHQTQRFVGEGPTDLFGSYVKLDPAGKTLVISHNQPGGVHREGTLEVYKLSEATGQFVHATTIETPFEAAPWAWCRSIALSSMGDIARVCFDGTPYADLFTQVLSPVSTAPLQYSVATLPVSTGHLAALDASGKHVAVVESPGPQARLAIWRHDAAGWVRDSSFTSIDFNHMSMSGDGKFLALGWGDDTLAGVGPVFPPYQTGNRTGTVALYERRTSGWSLRRFIKAGTDRPNAFGWRVELDHTGKVLAVGAPYDDSKATGIDGDREDTSVQDRGAVWLY